MQMPEHNLNIGDVVRYKHDAIGIIVNLDNRGGVLRFPYVYVRLLESDKLKIAGVFDLTVISKGVS